MDWRTLDQGDTDLGGSGAIVFDLPGATPSALLATFGKDGNIYLSGRQNMGGIGAPLVSFNASSRSIINASVFYTTTTAPYLAFAPHDVVNCGGVTGASLVSVKLTAGNPPSIAAAWCAAVGAGRGSPMVTTTDGTANGIVWAVSTNEGGTSTNRLYGFDADTGAPVYSATGAGNQMGPLHRFITPIVAKGRIFVAGDGKAYAYKTN